MPSIDSIVKPKQRAALEYLSRAAKGYRLIEAPFVTLPPETPAKSITALMVKDLIVPSTLLGQRAYKITTRGLKALSEIARIEARWVRADGLCRNGCGRPVYISPQGIKKAVCKDCHNANSRERYARLGNTYNPHKLCSRCKRGRRHAYKTGRVSVYCLACLRLTGRARTQISRLNLVLRVTAGAEELCRSCHVKPICLTINGKASLYCDVCGPRKRAQDRHRALVKRATRRHQMMQRR